MGSDFGEQCFQCPCYKSCKECRDFKEIINLKDTGLIIYELNNFKNSYKEEELVKNIDNITAGAFILQNTKDVEITSTGFIAEFGKNNISCPRCRNIIERTEKLLHNIPIISKKVVIGVCDHCFKKERFHSPCCKCDNIVKKFVTEYEKNKETEQLKIWISKIKNLLKDARNDGEKFRKRTSIEQSNLYQTKSSTTQETENILHAGTHKFHTNRSSPQFIFKDTVKSKELLAAPVANTYSRPDKGFYIIDNAKTAEVLRDYTPKREKFVELRQQFESKIVSDKHKTKTIFEPQTRLPLKQIISKPEKELLLAHDHKAQQTYDDSVIKPLQPISFRKIEKQYKGISFSEDKTYLKSERLSLRHISQNTSKFSKETKSNMESLELGSCTSASQRYETMELAQSRKCSQSILEPKKYHSEESMITSRSEEKEKALQNDFRFHFPKEKILKKNHKDAKNSAELILETQNMLISRNEEKRKGDEEENQRRLQERELIKNTRDEKNRLKEKGKAESDNLTLAEDKEKIENERDIGEKLRNADKEKYKSKDKINVSTGKNKSKESSRDDIGKIKLQHKGKEYKENLKSAKDKESAIKKEERQGQEEQLRLQREKASLKKDMEANRKNKEEHQKYHLQRKKGEEDKPKDQLEKKSGEEGKLEDHLQREKSKDNKQKDSLKKKKGEEDKPKDHLQRKRDEEGKIEDHLQREKSKEDKPKDYLQKKKGEEDKLKDHLQRVKGEEDKSKEDGKELSNGKDIKQIKTDKFQVEKGEKLDMNRNDKQMQRESLKQERVKGDIETKQSKKASIDISKEEETMLRMKKQEEENERKSKETAAKNEKHIYDSKQSNKKEADVTKLEKEKAKHTQQVKTDTKPTRELNINEIKVRRPSTDDLILQLVQLKQSEPKIDRNKTIRLSELNITPLSIKEHQEHKNAKLTMCLMCIDSDLELDVESIVLKKDQTKELADIILGQNIFKYKPPLVEKKDEKLIVPVVFQSVFDDKISLVRENETEKSPLAKLLTKYVKIDEQETEKGIIRYALSDRTFIDKGWTMLPAEKLVRKMNVYRMRPAHPEFDWFQHNKNKQLMLYDTGEKLAQFDDNGLGRWFYRNGRLALDYYDAEETNAQQRIVIYSSGEPDERGRMHATSILATFDYLGNGIVFDRAGKIRLKYNQTEGILLDRSIGPVSHWKWHTLNDPPVLQKVMIDTQMPQKDPEILKMGEKGDVKSRPDNEEMLAIEFDNFIKEKSKKLSQTFKPFQIKMKALKINENFSLKILDQATIYLIFRDGTTNLKLNIGMLLDHKEIVDTDTAEVGEVSNSLERFPPRTESLAGLQRSVAYAQRFEKLRTDRERLLHPMEQSVSIDRLTATASRPLRSQFRTVSSICNVSSEPRICKCSRKPSSTNLYYNTRLL